MGFRDRLVLLRKEKGLSQGGLGEKIGITQAAIWNWENDKRGPSLDMAGKIADFFCVSLDYLMGRTDERLHRETWVGEDGETYSTWSKKENLTPQEREAIEHIDETKMSGFPLSEIDKIPGLSEYIRRIVREETSSQTDKD